MSDFFRGWNRKLGCATLALSLVFTFAWVRSVSNVDELFYLSDRQTLHVLFSCRAGICWTRVREMTTKPILTGVGMPYLSLETMDSRYSNTVYPPSWTDTPKRLKWIGIRTGEVFMEGAGSLQEVRVWGISHASVVVPLTLLSAWLLLSKPRQPKSKAAPASLEDTVRPEQSFDAC